MNERTRRQVIWSCLEYGGKDSIMLAPDEADEISILDLAKTVAECMKFPLERLVQDTTKSDGQFKKTVRAQPARASAKPGGGGGRRLPNEHQRPKQRRWSHATSLRERGGEDETCPISTGGGTRRDRKSVV